MEGSLLCSWLGELACVEDLGAEDFVWWMLEKVLVTCLPYEEKVGRPTGLTNFGGCSAEVGMRSWCNFSSISAVCGVKSIDSLECGFSSAETSLNNCATFLLSLTGTRETIFSGNSGTAVICFGSAPIFNCNERYASLSGNVTDSNASEWTSDAEIWQPPPQHWTRGCVPPSPSMRRTSSEFWDTRMVEALRLLGPVSIVLVSSSSSFDSPEVKLGTRDLGDESIGGSSGMQCAVVLVRISSGLCWNDMIAAADGTIEDGDVNERQRGNKGMCSRIRDCPAY